MCNGLIKCRKNQSSDDCVECYEYTKKSVYSAQSSFGGNRGIKLCDCIIDCNGFYIAVEHKGGKLNQKEVNRSINQLLNCERNLKNVCGTARVYRVLLYGSMDIPPTKQELIKKKLRKHGVKHLPLETLRGKEICQKMA